MKTNHSKNYNDIKIEFNEENVTSTLDDILYLRELKQRKLYLNDEINSFSVGDIIKHIIQYNTEDKGKEVVDRKPILLYVSSNGGSVDDGFALIDVIKASATPIYCITYGYVYSMGFLIMLAGHKRIGSINSKYLLHDGSNGVWNSGSKVIDQIEFYKKVENKIKGYVLDNSSITDSEYNDNVRKEWYMLSDEAKAKGIIDSILGIDCSLDEVI